MNRINVDFKKIKMKLFYIRCKLLEALYYICKYYILDFYIYYIINIIY